MIFRRPRLRSAALLVAAALPAVAANPPAHVPTTYYVDGVAGSDANAGTSRSAAWRTLAKAYSKINDAVIVGGDSIMVRPGVYRALDGPTGTSLRNTVWRLLGVSGQTRGGTAGHPITFSVDTFYSGNVEITGAVPAGFTGAGQTRSTVWAAVSAECSSSGVPWYCCTGAGTGCTGLWYSDAPSPNNTTGTGPGVCFQPGSNPGDTPVMWEILYAPPTAPITMPTFTAGRNQCWIRPEYSDHCTALDEPYDCCTAAGTGPTCLGTVRVYAQTATGVAPDAISPPVEFPVAPDVFDIGKNGEVQYVTFSNANNGRTFYWRWGVTNVLKIWNAHHLTFEDFEVGYNSTVRPMCGSGSGPTCTPGTKSVGTRAGSGFPRDTSGPSYLIFQTAKSSTDSHHHQTFRRGVILRPQGDETIHQGSGPLFQGDNPASCTTVTDCTQTALGTAVLCSSSVCYYHDNTTSGSDLYEDLEFTDIPWEVLNGHRTPYGYSYSWPPAGYGAWNSQYSTHFSPLGGGAETPGAWIMQGANNVLRRIYVHNQDGVASFESSGDGHSWPAGNVVEDSIFDGTQMQYAGNAAASTFPACATCRCDSTSGCNGFSSNHFVKDNVGGWDIDQAGTIWRNNVFRNCYGACWTAVRATTGSGRATAPEFVNNVVQSVGDHSRAGMNNPRFSLEDKWGTVAAPGIVKNNIFIQDNVGTAKTFLVHSGDTSTVVIDYNLYGAANNRWEWGGTVTTNWATWKSTSGQDANSPSPADPLFASSPLDLHLTAGSPAVDAGTTLSGFSHDHDGVTRPQGTAWDIGAYELFARELGPPAPHLMSATPLH